MHDLETSNVRLLSCVSCGSSGSSQWPCRGYWRMLAWSAIFLHLTRLSRLSEVDSLHHEQLVSSSCRHAAPSCVPGNPCERQPRVLDLAAGIHRSKHRYDQKFVLSIVRSSIYADGLSLQLAVTVTLQLPITKIHYFATEETAYFSKSLHSRPAH